MTKAIAIVGMACRYPDAVSPQELWTNVLAGRRAFRRIPDERMRLADYWSPDPTAPDKFYTKNAAVIEGFEFDRVRYKIAGSTYRATDLTHWLALDTAARALEDAGFSGGEGLPKRDTAVLVGNTLTGEFARANLMRLRWPYVRRTVSAALQDQGWDEETLAGFLSGLETRYKTPFPPVDEDTLAGGLSNTIAGRICNQFDFKGGGFSVDGACSSSLLAVAMACTALQSGQIDAALVGGVDLSIDPFEVIGFAKTGALATSDMRVYDRNSGGFWPGEGCGMLVLLRQEDAQARGSRAYATIAGWGYSSDGRGGITRPEAEGHRLALERAYEVAGFDIGTVGYLEGHGTGTAIGDETELRALGQARRDARPAGPAVAIGTVKGNIGHTKAAAGVAGLIKATMAVHHQVIPPATSHFDPHPELTSEQPALRVPAAAELWPAGQPIRAGVSSMGFGGINAHVVVAGNGGTRREELDSRTLRLVRSRQDCELLLLDADSPAELRDRASQLAGLASRLAFAEVADLAVVLQRELKGRPVRGAVVAATPEEAARRLAELAVVSDRGEARSVDTAAKVFFGQGTARPRLGYLFPGQGSGRRGDGGALARRFDPARELYESLPRPPSGDLADTASAQPRIVASSIAALRVLALLGIEADGAVGHSLGELTSLYWAGAMTESELLSLAAIRGKVMASASAGGGAMASISAGPQDVEPFLRSEPVVIAGYNGPRQTVVSGLAAAVDRVRGRASASGLASTRIAVSHAFHSPAVAPAATEFAVHLADRTFRPMERRVFSTVTGEKLAPDTDARDLLIRQVLEPVRFHDAAGRLAADADLLLEVGPGQVLTGLAAEIAADVPVVAVEADSTSLAGLLSAAAAAFVLGAPVRTEVLSLDRFARPLPLDKEFSFFASPCEQAPADAGEHQAPAPADPGPQVPGGQSAEESLAIVRRLTAERAELPLDAVRADSRPLDDLHFSSITVGQIVNQAARELGVPVPLASAGLATATLAELAQMLDDVAGTAQPGDGESRQPDGVAPWVRAFRSDLVPESRRPVAATGAEGTWQVFASPGHPLAEPLGLALNEAGLGDGVLLCLPDDCDETHVGLMLAAARAALASEPPVRFLAIQSGRGAAGLVKTLHLEAPAIACCVVSLPRLADLGQAAIAEAVGRVVADVAATTGFSEVCYDEAGERLVPVLRPIPEAGPRTEPPLDRSDVLLVTGGGKGVTAECALALAGETGAALGLIGRSDPAADAELAANLDRLASAGIAYHYARADVSSPSEVAAAVDEIAGALGPVTAVFHGAGRNEPVPLAQLDEAAFLRTLAPKIAGLEAVLAAVNPASLKLLITFGSIIGRAGLRGQADYATANDWLTERACRVQREHPRCRCLALEWSVWAGAGMGERLGVLESLARDGVSAIPLDEGISMLTGLLHRPDLPTVLVIMSRVGDLPTITLEPRELPLLRFIDRPLVYYPGIELVAEADLSTDNDPYLADHLLDGELLFPAVFGIEAMTQAASALTGAALTESWALPVLENVEFHRPIVVPADGSVTIRVAALRRGDIVDAVIRSEDTGFQADHFRATLRWTQAGPADEGQAKAVREVVRVKVDPRRDLYGDLFFQGPRFQRVLGYRGLAATSCVAEISTTPAGKWFGTYLPADLLLGDPGARDAFMHAIQSCIPHATLLPEGIGRVSLKNYSSNGTGRLVLDARERQRNGDSYTYDLEVRDAEGRLVERWEELRLRAVRKQDGAGPWAPALLGPYLERRLAELLPCGPRCVVEPDDAGPTSRASSRERTRLAVSRLTGPDAVIRYRPDGKPQLAEGGAISVSHGAGVTFAVAHSGQVGCDVQLVPDRTNTDWRLLLAGDQLTLAELIECEHAEPFPVAATRVWGAVECLRKIGRADTGPITLAESRTDGWVLLRAGQARVATFATALRYIEPEARGVRGVVPPRADTEAAPAVFTILAEGDS